VRVIALKSDLPADRHRFALAHELSHLLNLVEGLDEEKAANRFAGALLAPRERVIEELGERRSRLSPVELHALKHKYGLSMQAWVYRARDLGVISAAAAQQIHAWFRKNRVHREEPGDALPRERPTRFLRLVLQAVEEGQIGRQRASELLNRSLEQTLSDFGVDHPDLEAVLGR
jgi:Zn-dependent peptidase ImmA (M78 family)